MMLRIFLNKNQLKCVSDFFSDLAKIIFGSAIIGFLIPGINGNVNVKDFFTGAILAFAFLIFGIYFLKNHE